MPAHIFARINVGINARAIPTPRAFSDVQGPPRDDLSRVVKSNSRPVVHRPTTFPFRRLDQFAKFFPPLPSSSKYYFFRLRVLLRRMEIYFCTLSQRFIQPPITIISIAIPKFSRETKEKQIFVKTFRWFFASNMTNYHRVDNIFNASQIFDDIVRSEEAFHASKASIILFYFFFPFFPESVSHLVSVHPLRRWKALQQSLIHRPKRE